MRPGMNSTIKGLAFALATLSLSMSMSTYAAEECVSDNPAVTAMRASWNRPKPAEPETHVLNGGFDAVHAVLPSYDNAAARYGQLALKARKDIKYFAPFVWRIAKEGDYWLSADSGVWIDVFEADKPALQPLAFNHGLRCAGIYKALEFHLTAGTYRLVIASEGADAVTFAAKPDGGK